MPVSTQSELWCKICGVTNVEDALVAQNAGANALGLNCYPPSPRYVDLAQIGALASPVRCTRVALFVDAPLSEVEAVLAAAPIDMLQFQGEESPQYCAQFGLPYMKGIRVQASTDIQALSDAHADAWALLLDAYVPGLHGGTGQSFDLSLWPDVPSLADRRLILAGGLTADNVYKAATQTHPFGVDICGGVEGPQKGTKDHQKINHFISEVRRVER